MVEEGGGSKSGVFVGRQDGSIFVSFNFYNHFRLLFFCFYLFLFCTFHRDKFYHVYDILTHTNFSRTPTSHSHQPLTHTNIPRTQQLLDACKGHTEHQFQAGSCRISAIAVAYSGSSNDSSPAFAICASDDRLVYLFDLSTLQCPSQHKYLGAEEKEKGKEEEEEEEEEEKEKEEKEK